MCTVRALPEAPKLIKHMTNGNEIKLVELPRRSGETHVHEQTNTQTHPHTSARRCIFTKIKKKMKNDSDQATKKSVAFYSLE